MNKFGYALTISVVLVGCSGSGPGASEFDSGVPDAAVETDASTPDSGRPDSGTPDAGEPTPDAGQPDAGAPDSGTPDAGTSDAGEPDSGTPDAGTPEPDAGEPPPPPACQDVCGGCCTPEGICLAGDTVDACGLGGAYCTICAEGDACGLGSCSEDLELDYVVYVHSITVDSTIPRHIGGGTFQDASWDRLGISTPAPPDIYPHVVVGSAEYPEYALVHELIDPVWDVLSHDYTPDAMAVLPLKVIRADGVLFVMIMDAQQGSEIEKDATRPCTITNAELNQAVDDGQERTLTCARTATAAGFELTWSVGRK